MLIDLLWPHACFCGLESYTKPCLLTMRHRLIEAGCPHNVPAGHYANLDHLVAHYRKEHLEEEERKLKRLADAKKVN